MVNICAMMIHAYTLYIHVHAYSQSCMITKFLVFLNNNNWCFISLNFMNQKCYMHIAMNLSCREKCIAFYSLVIYI